LNRLGAQSGSASLQAARIKVQRQDRELAEALEAIFTPGAMRVNRIFVSYSHKNLDWHMFFSADRARACSTPERMDTGRCEARDIWSHSH
jgi:hypothetical protein